MATFTIKSDGTGNYSSLTAAFLANPAGGDTYQLYAKPDGSAYTEADIQWPAVGTTTVIGIPGYGGRPIIDASAGTNIFVPPAPNGVSQPLVLSEMILIGGAGVGIDGGPAQIEEVSMDHVMIRDCALAPFARLGTGSVHTRCEFSNNGGGYIEVPSGIVQCADPQVGDFVTAGGVALTAVESHATGTIQSNNPGMGVLIAINPGLADVELTAVLDTSAGSISTAGAGPAAGDTVTVGTIPFTCVEDAGTGSVTCLGVNVADEVVIKGVTFTAAAAADLPNQVFDQSGTDQQCADSLVAAVNHANAQALFAAENGPSGYQLNVVCSAANGGGASTTVTLTAGDPGDQGAFELSSSDGVTLAVSGAVFTYTSPDPDAAEYGSAAFYGEDGGTQPNIAISSLAASINSATPRAAIAAANSGVFVYATPTTGVCGLSPNAAGTQGDLALAESTAGVRQAVSGASMTHTAADPALGQYDSLLNAIPATNIGVATSIVAAINDAATQALLTAASAGGAVFAAVNGGGASDTVTVTADLFGGAGGATVSCADPSIVLSGDIVATPPDPAAAEFGSYLQYDPQDGSLSAGEINDLCAASIVAAVNDATTQLAIIAAGAGETFSATAFGTAAGIVVLGGNTPGVYSTLTSSTGVRLPIFTGAVFVQNSVLQEHCRWIDNAYGLNAPGAGTFQNCSVLKINAASPVGIFGDIVHNCLCGDHTGVVDVGVDGTSAENYNIIWDATASGVVGANSVAGDPNLAPDGTLSDMSTVFSRTGGMVIAGESLIDLAGRTLNLAAVSIGATQRPTGSGLGANTGSISL